METTLADTTPDINLTGTTPCARCPHPAQYAIVDKCCGRSMVVCGSCETRLNARWTYTLIRAGFLSCTRCRTQSVRVEDALTTNLI